MAKKTGSKHPQEEAISLPPTPPVKKSSKKKENISTKAKNYQRAAILLKHISDPTRLQIIRMLATGEQHVGAISVGLRQSQPAVSHHLALLRHGGIIIPRRQGKNNFYLLTDSGEQLAELVAQLME